MFLALLCTRRKGSVTTEDNLNLFSTFGFQEGGTFSLKIKTEAESVIFGLLSDNQLNYTTADNVTEEFMKTDWHPTFYKNYNSSASPEKEDILTGNITEKGVYTPFIISLDNASYSFDFEFVFHNKDFFMDYRSKPLLITAPIMMCANIVITALWLLNWFCNFGVQIYIHYIFTAQFIVSVLSNVTYFIYVMCLKTTDNVTVAAGFYVFFDLMRAITILIVFLLAAKGWGIIVDTIKFKDLILSLVMSTLSAIFLLLVDFPGLSITWNSIICLLALITLGIYIYQLTKAIEVSSLMITAHMMVIQNAGIDPTTTPVQKKQDMYTHFHYAFIAYLVLILIRLGVSLFSGTDYWINSFLAQLFDTIQLVLIGIIFRIRDKDNDGYTIIGDSNGEEFVLSDIETARQDNENPNGIEWKPGMKLPSRPVIVKAPTVAILETPEGVEEVNVTIKDNTTETMTA